MITLRETLASGLLGAALITSACRGRSPRDASPAPARDDPAACATCHAREAEEWGASLHRASFTDADFQRSFALEPLDFCFRCHAPAATSRDDHAGAARGVSCVTCHTDPHRAARARACADCHEFRFPEGPALMQSTAREHARSSYASTPCVDCHMRGEGGRVEHRMRTSRNVGLLRRAIRVRAELRGDALTVRLETAGVGHAMPTGDLFRRLRLTARGEDATGRALGGGERLLTRRFDRSGDVAVESEDTRVLGAREEQMRGAWVRDAARVVVELRYERVAQAGVARDGGVEEPPLFASELLHAVVVRP